MRVDSDYSVTEFGILIDTKERRLFDCKSALILVAPDSLRSVDTRSDLFSMDRE